MNDKKIIPEKLNNFEISRTYILKFVEKSRKKINLE